MKTRKPSLFTFFINVVIDILLLGLGCILYYHFMVQPFAPIDLHPVLIQLFGGNRQLAVQVISGAFLLTGGFGLIRSIFTVLRGTGKQPLKQ